MLASRLAIAARLLAALSPVFLCWSCTAAAQGKSLEACVSNFGGSLPSFLEFDRELRTALSTNDSTTFAMLVKYPLRINESGGTVLLASGAAVQTRFEQLFSNRVRSAILNTKAEDLICTAGAIGYGNGALWVGSIGDDAGPGRYAVTALNPPDVPGDRPRAGPRVEFVCRTTTLRALIDVDSAGNIRFQAWNEGKPVVDVPDETITSGIRRPEGSGLCAHETWKFTAGATAITVAELGCSESSPPPLAIGTMTVSRRGRATRTQWCF